MSWLVLFYVVIALGLSFFVRAIVKRIFGVVHEKKVLPQKAKDNLNHSSYASKANLSWDYTPAFFSGQVYPPCTILPPHQHLHSCVVTPSSSSLADIRLRLNEYPCVPIEQITDLGVLEKSGSFYRICRHGVTGWIFQGYIRPLMCLHSTKYSSTKLLETHHDTTQFVKTEHDAFVEIPNGSLVAIISENGIWVEVACIINDGKNDCKYTGFVRRDYIFEARF
jgi:hypothetical protein